jgi:hypothetical protein
MRSVPRAEQPTDGDELSLILGWLAFYRGALDAKAADLPPEQLIKPSVPPSSMSLLGLIRHLSEMERLYGSFAFSGGSLELRYCRDNPEGDFDNLVVQDILPSIEAWRDECRASDDAIAGVALDECAPGNGLTVRWNLMKLLGEYARHAGHADLLRERIDGTVGE